MRRSKEESLLEMRVLEMKQELKEYLSHEVAQAVIEKMEELLPIAVERKVNSILDMPLTVRQVSHLTGHTEQSIYKMCQRDQIPYTKMGSCIHINLRDINSNFLSLRPKAK